MVYITNPPPLPSEDGEPPGLHVHRGHPIVFEGGTKESRGEVAQVVQLVPLRVVHGFLQQVPEM